MKPPWGRLTNRNLVKHTRQTQNRSTFRIAVYQFWDSNGKIFASNQMGDIHVWWILTAFMVSYKCKLCTTEMQDSEEIDRAWQNQQGDEHVFTLWPLCGYHISTRRRRRIPKTVWGVWTKMQDWKQKGWRRNEKEGAETRRKKHKRKGRSGGNAIVASKDV